jgi:hypothetical protein
MSGTGTQVADTIDFFRGIGKKIKDLRGTEIDALFHAEIFSNYNSNFISLRDFLNSTEISQNQKEKFIFEANNLLIGGGTNEDLKIASCVRNQVSTYIDPDSADVWILEEPTKRGAGQVNRTIEQQRTQYNSSLDATAAAYCHSIYRVDEFLRFRKILREKNKIIIRSRSEESACYQIYDENYLKNGIDRALYISLPGHQFAFGYPPTHVFIVCAKPDWTREEFLEMKKMRSAGRFIDDHEANMDYQLLTNKRYATNWFDDLYQEACSKYGTPPPEITRFDIYASKEEIKRQMSEKIKIILNYE